MKGTLTKERPNRLADLMIGLFWLTGACALVASLSPIVAAFIFAAVTVGYLVSLHSRERREKRVDAAPTEPPPTAADTRAALDELDRALASARPVPLTAEVRVDADVLDGRLATLVAALDASGDGDLGVAVRRLRRGARPVPLTDHVRVDREQATKLLARARTALGVAQPSSHSRRGTV